MPPETSHQKSPPAPADWALFRQLMPVANDWAYFDHAAVAPLPQPSLDAISKWASEAALVGDAKWPEWKQQHEQCRTIAAELVQAAENEIALVPNTTFGINIVAEGLDWQPGDNVVIPDNEFPSNAYPWLALETRGVEVRRVPTDANRICLDKIIESCDLRTRVVSVSWVGYASGYRIDPKQFAEAIHQTGALFFLDAIQGMGVFPLDVKDTDIDFLAADGHKWMLGPEGAGIFYMKSELIDRLRPINVGWNSVVHSDFSIIDLNLRPAASRYEGGTQNMAGFIGLAASLNLLSEFGLTHQASPIADQVIQITDKICEAFADNRTIVHSIRESDCRSGIVQFEVPGHEPTAVRSAMMANNVNISCRGGHLRVAAHCYNNENDIDRLIETIREVRQ